MIAHVVLYRFPDSMGASDRERFLADLVAATRAAGSAERFRAGSHRALPEADSTARDSLFSVAARWEFDDMHAMRHFAAHPAVTGVVDRWVAEAGIGVAFANTQDEMEVVPT